MDYIGNKCPVCNNYFHANDDIVVCPECGTPHHRECYESLSHCAKEDLHAEGYDFAKENEPQEDESIICKRCGHKNEKDAFFCNKCALPLNQDTAQNPFSSTQGNFGQTPPYTQQTSQNSQGMPFSMPFDPFDPLSGVPSDFDMGNSVTAGEMSKYVKQNTPYFIRVFSNIKNFTKSKFNFSAAIFTGIYLLYRKMYKIGAVITAIQLAILSFSVYIDYYVLSSSEFTTIMNKINNLAATGLNSQATLTKFTELMNSLTGYQIFVLYLPMIFNIIQIVLMVVIGCCANRMYYNHCLKQIGKIKEKSTDKQQSDTLLQTKGGVNTALAASMFITYIVINYLPAILMNF